MSTVEHSTRPGIPLGLGGKTKAGRQQMATVGKISVTDDLLLWIQKKRFPLPNTILLVTTHRYVLNDQRRAHTRRARDRYQLAKGIQQIFIELTSKLPKLLFCEDN
ncbi:hypothetical protein VULLAG_LOCUS9178 [Vulpes lagopus]